MGLLFEFNKGSAIIRYMASKEGISEEQIRQEMQQAIDETWTTTDPDFLQLQKAYFPNGKPTPEEFIIVIADTVKEKSEHEDQVRFDPDGLFQSS